MIEITRATESRHFFQVAHLHCNYISTGFLSSLGEQLLSQIYRFIAEDEDSILYVAVVGENVVGFISGTTNVNSFFKRFIIKKWSFALQVLPKLFSISRLKKIVETLLYPSKHNKISMPSAELLSIVLDEKFQGKDIAQQLYQHLVFFFKTKKKNEFKIIVGNNLSRAIKFYEKMGAVKLTEIEIHAGSKSWVLVHHLK